MNALLLKVYLANCERVIVSEHYFLSLPGYEWSPSQRISQITILLVCCWVTALAGTLQVKPNLCNSSTCWSLSFCTEFYRLSYKSWWSRPICILRNTYLICPNSPENWSVSQAVNIFIVVLSLVVDVCRTFCSKQGSFVTFVFFANIKKISRFVNRPVYSICATLWWTRKPYRPLVALPIKHIWDKDWHTVVLIRQRIQSWDR